MPCLKVTTSDGQQTTIEGAVGDSLMELMVDNGIDELEAQCGGSCACATCHVWVAPEFFDRLPPMSEQEDDMLHNVERKENSRLSCQIKLTEDLDGIEVEVAPAPY